jgi:hypothetical protein
VRKSNILFCAAAGLAACSQSPDNSATKNVAGNAAAAVTPKPAYCFFKDSETKGWKAALDEGGNVVVSGKAYREDSRYKAILSPATVRGAAAEVAPTIAQNDTGFASPDNWWAVTQTIPNSQAVETVTVKCGAKTLAILKVPRKK